MSARVAVGTGAAAVLLCLVALPLAAQTAAERGVVHGTVREAATARVLPGAAVIVEGTRLFALTDSAGRYVLTGVPPGPQVLRAELIGYGVTRTPIRVPPSGRLTQDVELAVSAIEVAGVVVSADPAGRARGELATASVIGEEAIRNQVAASLAGVLELVPGVPLSPPGIEGVQQIALRAVPVSAGGVGSDGASASDIASFGTAIILDGVPLSNNANLQAGPRGESSIGTAAGGGIDLRRIPATTIERVEVIRGVPSARYGDLTQGVIVVDTRAGAVDPLLTFRYDAHSLEGSALAGHAIGPRHVVTGNFDVARTRSSLTRNGSYSQRVAAQLAHRMQLGGRSRSDGGEARVTLDTRLDFFRLDREAPEDTTVQRGLAAWTHDRGIRLAERALLRYSPTTRIEWTASVEKGRQRTFQQNLRSRGATPFTDRTTEGRAIGRYIGGTYLARFQLEGDPWLLYTRLEGQQERTLFGLEHRLRAGTELRREWNAGAGYVFDMEFPPQAVYPGIHGFDRPRRFDATPPVATSAFYVDDRVIVPLGAASTLDLQGGLRLDLLHEQGHPLAGTRDGVLQPRLNVQLAPRPWVRVRAGAGRTAKLPTLGQLFPAPQYYDVINVNWYTNDPAERLAVLTTFVREPTNTDLGYSVGRKLEAGVEVDLGTASTWTLVAFDDRIAGAVGVDPAPGYLLRENYELSDSTLGTGRPPTIIEPAASADTVPFLLARPANNTDLRSRGLELTARLPELRQLRTRLELQGSFVRSRLKKHGMDTGSGSAFGAFQLDARIPRTPYWESPERYGERVLLTTRLVHHQPPLGLVITATVQHAVRQDQYDVGGTDTLAFAGYITRDGQVVAVAPAQRADPEFADLRSPRSGLLTSPNPTPYDWFVNLQVAKTLPLEGRLTFYAFNALDRVGKYGTAGRSAQLFPSMRFGLDVTMPARALAQLVP